MLTALDAERVTAEVEARHGVADERRGDQYEPSSWTRYVLRPAGWPEVPSTSVFDVADDDA